MGVPMSLKKERRIALIKLQRLLSQAEASLSADGAPEQPIFDNLSHAFDHFRSRYHDQAEVAATETPGAEARRLAVRRLAGAIVDMDESLTARDSPRMRAALDVAREALDTYERIEQSSSSGLRLRLRVDSDEDTGTKRGTKR
jgi:hypothetical protein